VDVHNNKRHGSVTTFLSQDVPDLTNSEGHWQLSYVITCMLE